MSTNQNSDPSKEWVGGFAESNPDFAYPEPNLTSLKLLDNLANIDLLDRQQKVLWPEFSWETVPGDPDSRCYQMFSPDISRLGYTSEGRVYSIICPQQGTCSPTVGCMNVEVTVTGQRGWANEDNREIAGDMKVEGTIWFSPSAQQKPAVQKMWKLFRLSGLPFPISKGNAIKIRTHLPGNSNQLEFPLRKGETSDFKIPDFARHVKDAWSVGHLSVQIGGIKKTGYKMIDDFSILFMDLFNMSSGNMLKEGNILTWNVWFAAPEVVDQKEWAEHAEVWRRSIQADHGSPTGPGTEPRYYDGTLFSARKEFLESLEDKVGDGPHARSVDDIKIPASVKEEEAKINNFLEEYA